MSESPGYHNCKEPICSKIRSLFISLTKEPSKYDQITPKIEYWIERVLGEDLMTVDGLVDGVSYVAWCSGGPFESVGRFLKEFRDAPHRSEKARSFVTQLCSDVFRWFMIGSVEDLWAHSTSSVISIGGGPGFMRAASFVGHLIERGLLDQESVQRHLIKSLTNHYDDCERQDSAEAVRANAIYQLFVAAGNTLLQGLLSPEDVQVCFGILDTRFEWIIGFESAKIQVQCAFRHNV
jgi:hypothetical protein